MLTTVSILTMGSSTNNLHAVLMSGGVCTAVIYIILVFCNIKYHCNLVHTVKYLTHNANHFLSQKYTMKVKLVLGGWREGKEGKEGRREGRKECMRHVD